MHIFIQAATVSKYPWTFGSCRMFKLEVQSTDSIELIKQRIYREERIHTCKRGLIYDSQRLKDGNTLESYKIQAGAILSLVDSGETAPHIQFEVVASDDPPKVSSHFIVKMRYCMQCQKTPTECEPSQYVTVYANDELVPGAYEVKPNEPVTLRSGWTVSTLIFYTTNLLPPGSRIDVRVAKDESSKYKGVHDSIVATFHIPNPVTLNVKVNGGTKTTLRLARFTSDSLTELRTAIIAVAHVHVNLDQIRLIQRIGPLTPKFERHGGPLTIQQGDGTDTCPIESSWQVNHLKDGDTLLISVPLFYDDDLTQSGSTREDVLSERMVQLKQEKLDAIQELNETHAIEEKLGERVMQMKQERMDAEESKMELEVKCDRMTDELSERVIRVKSEKLDVEEELVATKRKAENDLQESTKRIKLIEQELEAQKEENEQIRLICSVCRVAPPSMVYQCGHLTCCKVCDAGLPKRICPLCGVKIQGKKFVYF